MIRRATRSVPLLSYVLSACGATVLPQEAVRHNQAGGEFLAARDLDTAESSFRLALEYAPSFADARANLGLVALERGDLQAAEELLRGALRLNEDFGLAWSNLGIVLERRGRPDDARACYEAALRIDPGLANARYNLAYLLARRGALPEARAHLRRLVLVEPRRADALGLLAYVELRLGRQDEAGVRVDEALSVDAAQPLARAVRGTLRAFVGDFGAAVEDLEAASSDPLVGRQARLRLAAVHVMRGDDRAARAIFDRLVEEAPDDPGVRVLASHFRNR